MTGSTNELADKGPYHILLVHPDPILLDTLKHEFQSGGFALVSAHQEPKAGFDSFRRARFDVVVMPSTIGAIKAWSLVEMIRDGKFGYAHTPIAMLVNDGEYGSLSLLVDDHMILVRDSQLESIKDAVCKLVESQDRPSVLIVEDELNAADSATRALSKYFNVSVAHDGLTGLNAWKQHRHAIVVLDLGLPEMPGSEVLKEILMLDSNQPVVILTSNDTPEQHAEIMLNGATKFLAKTGVAQLHNACKIVHTRAAILRSSDESRQVQTSLTSMSKRVHVANQQLANGLPQSAQRQLSHAIAETNPVAISEDEWNALVSEYPS